MNMYNTHDYSQSGQSQPQRPAVYQDELWVAAQCREAISHLEQAMVAPPLQLTRDASAAVRNVVKMRDRIIEWQRLDGSGSDSERRQKALDRLNITLTLVVGVEYPSTSARRKMIEQARDLLKSILVDGLF
jgi:hypothetical protein